MGQHGSASKRMLLSHWALIESLLPEETVSIQEAEAMGSQKESMKARLTAQSRMGLQYSSLK